jgi:hypothetical protein
MTSPREPEWDPLIRIVGPILVEMFMWMYVAELPDGSDLHAYKHVATRRYLFLTADGRCFAYVGRHRYREVDDVRDAVHQALHTWESLLPGPTREERAALRALLAGAGS